MAKASRSASFSIACTAAVGGNAAFDGTRGAGSAERMSGALAGPHEPEAFSGMALEQPLRRRVFVGIDLEIVHATRDDDELPVIFGFQFRRDDAVVHIFG